MKKLIFAISCFFLLGQAKADVKEVVLQAGGLTCSMCNNAINKALRTLSFVQDVTSDIKNSTFTITFKAGTNADFDAMKKKVEDAGFFVAKFSVLYHFDKVKVANNQMMVLGGRAFHFLNVQEQTLDGDKSIQILDAGFVTAKTYKKNSTLTQSSCYKTGVASADMQAEGIKKGTRIFHVTI
jgi:copper chaperone CopZ